MIEKFLPRATWEAKLRRRGCKPLEGAGKLNTAEFWQGPNRGYPLSVPVEDDGTCEFWALQRVCDDLSKPPSPNPFPR